MRRLAPVDLRDPSWLRAVWGTGIGVVMTLAVAPYPLAGLVVADEVPHRIHNVVGAVQYLPLWALPVLMLSWGRDPSGALRIALASSSAMFAVGLWSGDLIPSLSWLPLLTFVPLMRRQEWTPRLEPTFVVAAALTIAVAWRHAPTLVGFQRLGMTDSHSLRFHFSGMAAAYLSMAGALTMCAVFAVGDALRRVVSATVLAAGVVMLVWPYSESSLPTVDAVLLVAAGVAGAFGCRAVPAIRRDRAGRPQAVAG